MSSLRPGRGHESRKSVCYTHEEWELLDPSPRDLEESEVQEERKKQPPEGSKGMVCAAPVAGPSPTATPQPPGVRRPFQQAFREAHGPAGAGASLFFGG